MTQILGPHSIIAQTEVSSLTVSGELSVSGASSTLTTENLIVYAQNTEIQMTSGTAGIEVNRGSSAAAKLVWDNSQGNWYQGMGGLVQVQTEGDLQSLLDIFLPVGALRIWPVDSTPPVNWMVCTGTKLSSQTTYSGLYKVLGSKFNDGTEGADEFRIPDVKSFYLIGNTAGGACSTIGLGGVTGTAGHTHLFPSHTHTVNHPHSPYTHYHATSHTHSYPAHKHGVGTMSCGGPTWDRHSCTTAGCGDRIYDSTGTVIVNPSASGYGLWPTGIYANSGAKWPNGDGYGTSSETHSHTLSFAANYSSGKLDGDGDLTTDAVALNMSEVTLSSSIYSGSTGTCSAVSSVPSGDPPYILANIIIKAV